MSKRILLLTFYYPPDLSAGSFRSVALVEALQRQAGDKVYIEVLTTQPNRYMKYAQETVSEQVSPGLTVRRVDLSERRDGFLGQAFSFWQYACAVRRMAKQKQYDLVVATSSRLMTAVLGTLIARRRQACLYVDVRDIFVENLKVLFPPLLARPLELFFGLLERWVINSADRVNLVSEGFLQYFHQRYPGKRFSLFSNGVDDAFVPPADKPSMTHPLSANEPVKVLYAGNIGDGQALHLILPDLASNLGHRVQFRIIGAGGRLIDLQNAVQAKGVKNVEVISPVSRSELMELYRTADVLFIHLNDKSAFERVLPSKLFEYAALGKPIWAGVSGYAAEFIAAEVSNSVVFPACDVQAAITSFENLQLGYTNRSDFIDRYARKRIMDSMAIDILDPC